MFTGSVTRTLFKNNSKLLIELGGVFLLIITTVITLISSRFAVEIPRLEQPVILLVSLMVFSGIGYFFISSLARNLICTKGLLIFIIGLGLALRIVTIFSTPILEDD